VGCFVSYNLFICINFSTEGSVFALNIDDTVHQESESFIINPAAAFVEDPFVESDSSSNISDTVTRGVLDAFYNIY